MAERFVNRMLARVDPVSAALSLVAIILGVLLPYYFEYRARMWTEIEIEQLSEDCYLLSDTPRKHKTEEMTIYQRYVPNAFGITINGEPYENIILSRWLVKNTGGRALQKEDFDRPLSVAVRAGGSILLVETVGTAEQVALWRWRLQQDRKVATLEPRIFNPGDSIFVCVAHNFVPEAEESEHLTWDIRALGLNKPKVIDLNARWKKDKEFGWDVYIEFHGFELFTLVGMAVVLSMLGILVARWKGVVWFRNGLGFLWVLTLTSLSWCTAEIIAWLTFKRITIAWWYAVPLLVLHVLLICILIRSHKKGVARLDWESAG